MTINLTPDLETAVALEARRLGTTPEVYVEHTLRMRLREQQPPGVEAAHSREQRLQRLLSIARPYGVAHSNEALSSEGLYD